MKIITKSNWWLFLIILICFIGMGFVIWIYPQYVGKSMSHDGDDWSNYGSYLGGTLTPLVAILGIAGVILTIVQQNELTRSASAASDTLEDENKILKLIEFHQHIINNLSIQDNSNQSKVWRGKEIFIFLYDRSLKGEVAAQRTIISNPPRTEDKLLADSFMNVYDAHGNHFGFYFRNLFYIFKSIDDCKSKIDKKYYANLVRAQFSTPEIQVLAYNCLFPKGHGFKKFVEDYSLLNGLDPNRELLDSSHQHFFDRRAFN